MTTQRFTALFLSGIAFLAGCQAKPVATTPVVTVATPDTIADLRAKVEKLKPGSLIGRVVASDTTGALAAVADLDIKDFHVGQTLSFVDADGNPFNTGTIHNIDNNLLVVQYDVQGTRPPHAGDLALYLKE